MEVAHVSVEAPSGCSSTGSGGSREGPRVVGTAAPCLPCHWPETSSPAEVGLLPPCSRCWLVALILENSVSHQVFRRGSQGTATGPS